MLQFLRMLREAKISDRRGFKDPMYDRLALRSAYAQRSHAIARVRWLSDYALQRKTPWGRSLDSLAASTESAPVFATSLRITALCTGRARLTLRLWSQTRLTGSTSLPGFVRALRARCKGSRREGPT